MDAPYAFLRAFFPGNWHFCSYLPGLPYFNKLVGKWYQNGEYQFLALVRKAPDPEYKAYLKVRGIDLLEPCNKIQTKMGLYFLCPILPLK